LSTQTPHVLSPAWEQVGRRMSLGLHGSRLDCEDNRPLTNWMIALSLVAYWPVQCARPGYSICLAVTSSGVDARDSCTTCWLSSPLTRSSDQLLYWPVQCVRPGYSICLAVTSNGVDARDSCTTCWLSSPLTRSSDQLLYARSPYELACKEGSQRWLSPHAQGGVSHT
jgi:hypothetical protein